MATLTSDEQSSFTSGQLTQTAKIRNDLLSSDASLRAKTLRRWASYSANQLRAVACYSSTLYNASGITVTWADECDLSTDEKTYVEDMIKSDSGKSPMALIVEAIGGARSTNQRLAALES